MIGLAGAHRTGKTSLARAVAGELKLPFVETFISEVYKSIGIDPALPMSFTQRMRVQDLILKNCIEKWEGYKGGFVSDRTPVDLMAYLMADIQGSTADGAEHLVAAYYQACLEALNRNFSMVMLIQPGIPVVPAPGKAALSMAYMEHLNTIMTGVMMRKDVKARCLFLRRDVIDLDDRIQSVMNSYKRMIKQELQNVVEAVALH